MTKYLLKRILHGIFSLVAVLAIVMLLVYSLMDRQNIFTYDTVYSKKTGNLKIVYENQQYQKYGYIDMVEFNSYINALFEDPNSAEAVAAKTLPASAENDDTNPYIEMFKKEYSNEGYEIIRLEGKGGGSGAQDPYLFAVRDRSVFSRLWDFFSNLIVIDTTNSVETDREIERYVKFTWDEYSNMPAIIGSGTTHKYLLYFDGSFPFIHQNFITLNLGQSTSLYKGVSIVRQISDKQGKLVIQEVEFPGQIGTGIYVNSSYDFHTATYTPGKVTDRNLELFGDYYTTCSEEKDGLSMLGNSFLIGILATLIAYSIGVPVGMWMARRKGKLADKIGMGYIIFIMAVPSLAYIFMFSAIGRSLFGLPTKFALEVPNRALVYILPIVSLALPSIASLMKWIRRYMIDQLNSDYVKFARSQGLSEHEIFRKHILRNAIIPIVHGIPGSILGCLTGAIITERVYAVPGMGKMLTEAINKTDNQVIVALTFFYTGLSIVSLLLGDILMAKIDPRISFSGSGGRK